MLMSYVGLELLRPFNRIHQVAPQCQIALPVSVTWLQWPWYDGTLVTGLPGLQFSHPIGLVPYEYGRCLLPSFTDRTLTVPWLHNRFGDRNFVVVGPCLWNSLPISLQQVTAMDG